MARTKSNDTTKENLIWYNTSASDHDFYDETCILCMTSKMYINADVEFWGLGCLWD